VIRTLRRAIRNRRVERAARNAFAGAVAGDSERFDAAIDAITNSTERFSILVAHLGHQVSERALLSIHHAEPAADTQLRRLSREFAAQEDWSGIDAKTALTYLSALNEGRPPTSALPYESVLPVTFAVGGWLLSAFIPDEVEWTDFLDGVLDRISRSGERINI
jgi:hypothetical protein